MLSNAWAFVQSRFVREDGATMVEYGLILAVIAIVALVGATLVGSGTDARFDQVDSVVRPAAP
jgi:Flp pilus assembly pilin Flp